MQQYIFYLFAVDVGHHFVVGCLSWWQNETEKRGRQNRRKEKESRNFIGFCLNGNGNNTYPEIYIRSIQNMFIILFRSLDRFYLVTACFGFIFPHGNLCIRKIQLLCRFPLCDKRDMLTALFFLLPKVIRGCSFFVHFNLLWDQFYCRWATKSASHGVYCLCALCDFVLNWNWIESRSSFFSYSGIRKNPK